MRSEFESRETFECIFGGEDGIDLSKDETGEYSFQPSRFAYSFFSLAWVYRQTEVDELKLQVAEMKSRLNDAYTDGQSAMYIARQSKVDELQKRVDDANLKLKRIGGIAYKARHGEYFTEGGRNAGLNIAADLEQALKGGEA